VVNGSQQGLDLCARLLLEPGDDVAMSLRRRLELVEWARRHRALIVEDGHLERHIRRMRRTYGLRRSALVESLRHHFGDRATVLGEAAGMHAYVRFAGPDVAASARRNKVQLRRVGAYFLGNAPANEYLLGFSMLTEQSLREGIKRLASGDG
jgi:DNA-binding transcriptional MocR family regulator